MRIDLNRLKMSVSVPAVLERAGIVVNKNKIPCPFCATRRKDISSPSMYVQTHRCYCYRCKKGGDIITLTMQLHNVSFREALTILRDHSGGLLEPDRRITAWTECEKLNEQLQFDLDRIECDWAGDWEWQPREGESREEWMLRTAGIRAGYERMIDARQMDFWSRSWEIMRRAHAEK